MVGLVDIGLSHNKKSQQISQHIIQKKSPCPHLEFVFAIRVNELNSNI